ncbi:putative signal transducing protein [Sungkyunkwania multivorans]|uniref:Signal transducing protein n=1 Tax=Sungkyunkwania multivorans TaxID=1173618 RepID=A0ABW3D057_9FLAO
MSDSTEFIDIYSGSEVRVIMLKGLLEEVGVTAVVQNEFQSGISAGFAGGTINTIRLKVHESELEKVRPIVDNFIKNQK